MRADRFFWWKDVLSKIIDPNLLLDLLTKELEITPILKKIFPKSYAFILDIVYYIVQTRQPLYRINYWSQINEHPFDDFIREPRFGELLLDI